MVNHIALCSGFFVFVCYTFLMVGTATNTWRKEIDGISYFDREYGLWELCFNGNDCDGLCFFFFCFSVPKNFSHIIGTLKRNQKWGESSLSFFLTKEDKRRHSFFFLFFCFPLFLFSSPSFFRCNPHDQEHLPPKKIPPKSQKKPQKIKHPPQYPKHPPLFPVLLRLSLVVRSSFVLCFRLRFMNFLLTPFSLSFLKKTTSSLQHFYS